jgi:hypothetical protein
VLQFEGNALYMHETDYKNGITKNGLWVALNQNVKQKARKFSGHYVIALGTFDAKDKGHMGAWSGSIKNITAVDLWPPKVALSSP